MRESREASRSGEFARDSWRLTGRELERECVAECSGLLGLEAMEGSCEMISSLPVALSCLKDAAECDW
jgi:hypothetical protein